MNTTNMTIFDATTSIYNGSIWLSGIIVEFNEVIQNIQFEFEYKFDSKTHIDGTNAVWTDNVDCDVSIPYWEFYRNRSRL